MKLWPQVIAGSLMLALCALIHISFLSVGLEVMVWAGATFDELHRVVRWILVLLVAFGAALAGHTAQVWIWAVVLHARGVFSTIGSAVYFSLVTSTTLGYGDITLDQKWRVFGAMAAVTGLLTFGLSTAFLAGVTGHYLKDGY